MTLALTLYYDDFHLSTTTHNSIINEGAREVISDIEERYKLDRRQVEASHMQYAVLQLTSWYPEVFSAKEVLMHSGIDKTLVLCLCIMELLWHEM